MSFAEEEKLKSTPQCIYVSNHNSHMDTAAFLSLIPTEKFLSTHPIAASDYFTKHIFIGSIVKFFFNVIYIERKTKEKTREEILRPINTALKEGRSILFFPEGSRGEPEVMSEFKTGIALILKENPTIPFVPLFMKGMGKAMPKGDPVLVPHESKIYIGKPVYLNEVESMDNHEITNRIKEEILKLSAQ